MTLFSPRLLVTLVGLTSWGCAEDLCADREPAFQVDISLGNGIQAARITRMNAEVSAAGLKKAVALNVDRIRTTGRASFDVTVGPAGQQGFEAVVRVDAMDAGGLLLARAAIAFRGSPDACNLVGMTLQRAPGLDSGPRDGGVDLAPATDSKITPKVDLPRPDINAPCGPNGSSCLWGLGTCFNGTCCTGCWDNGFLGVTCQPGNTGKFCGLGGSICFPCNPLFKCDKGKCVPAFP